MADRVLVFVLAGRKLALPLAAVGECLPLPNLERRPDLPPALAGFAVVAGRLMPVVDLAVLLGLRPADAAAFGERGGLYRHLVTLGPALLLVDRVLAVAEAAPGPVEAMADGWQHDSVVARASVAGEEVAVLAPERLLTAAERERLEVLREAETARERRWRGAAAPG